MNASGSWDDTFSILVVFWGRAPHVWPGVKEPTRPIQPIASATVALAVPQWSAEGRFPNMSRSGEIWLVPVPRPTMFGDSVSLMRVGSVLALARLLASRWPAQCLEQLLASARLFHSLALSSVFPRLHNVAVVHVLGHLVVAGLRSLRYARVVTAQCRLAAVGFARRLA